MVSAQTRRVLQVICYAALLPVYLLGKIVPKRPDLFVFGSALGCHFADNTKYLLLYLQEQHPEVDALFVTRSRDVAAALCERGLRAAPLMSLHGIWSILRAHRFPRYHLLARYESLGIAAKVNIDAISVNSLDETRQHFTNPVPVFLDNLLALCLPNLLHNDLFGCLGSNPAEIHRFHRFLDVPAGLCVRIHVYLVLLAALRKGRANNQDSVWGFLSKNPTVPICMSRWPFSGWAW